MNGIDFERERIIRDDRKGRWTPWLMAGAMICYALSGLMGVAMMSGLAVSPAIVCAVEVPYTGEIESAAEIAAVEERAVRSAAMMASPWPADLTLEAQSALPPQPVPGSAPLVGR